MRNFKQYFLHVQSVYYSSYIRMNEYMRKHNQQTI